MDHESFGFSLKGREKFALSVWAACLFACSLAATLVIVRRAVAHPHAVVPARYLVDWGAATGGALITLGVLAGALAFARDTPLHVVVLSSLLGGLPVAAGYGFGISGQMDSGSALCGPNEPCDLSWGFGAVMLAVAAAVGLSCLTLLAFLLKRLLTSR